GALLAEPVGHGGDAVGEGGLDIAGAERVDAPGSPFAIVLMQYERARRRLALDREGHAHRRCGRDILGVISADEFEALLAGELRGEAISLRRDREHGTRSGLIKAGVARQRG